MTTPSRQLDERRRVLRAGPWCWPTAGEEARRAALELVPEGPPAARPGELPLVAVSPGEEAGWLWRLCVDDESSILLRPFVDSAATAWADAAHALSRSLPVLWADLRETRAHPHTADFLREQATSAASVCLKPATLSGSSFGLAFVLAMASMILDRPIPAEYIACATVDAGGKLTPVGSLPRKLATVASCAPAIRYVLVAPEQDIAAARIPASLTLIPVATVSTALARVFDAGAFVKRLHELGEDAAARREIVRFFRRVTLHGRAILADWGAVAEAASVALDHWPALAGEERLHVEHARAVACRHAGRPAPAIISPGRAALERMPPPIAIKLLAQRVQQFHDYGEPAFSACGDWDAVFAGGPFAVEIERGFTPHLELWGARARLLAVTGHPAQAMALQKRLALAWEDRLEYGQISFPLSEWFRLAGALAAIPHDGEPKLGSTARAEAEHFRQRVRATFDMDSTGASFVELAALRARLEACGARSKGSVPATEMSDAQRHLRALIEEPRTPAHVRNSARRWLAALLAAGGEAEASARILRGLSTGGSTAPLFRALAHLDAALRSRDENRQQEALAELAASDGGQPGPRRHLMRVANPPGGRAAYVACFYPY